MMSDTDDTQDQTGLPPGGLSLGGLAAGDFDSSLGGASAADAGPLDLPRGALVAFRKSGGMRFTSRGVVVTRSGWVEPMAGTPGRRRHITAAALTALERLLLQSGLTRVRGSGRAATRDGYAYEIAAHIGGRQRSVELHDPIPPEQERLVRVLSRLLPQG